MLEFWFEFASTYSYLAAMRVERTARDAGHDVWIVTRGERPVPEGVTALTADRKDPAAFAEAVEGAGMAWDLAVDCIGYQPEDARQDIEETLTIPVSDGGDLVISQATGCQQTAEQSMKRRPFFFNERHRFNRFVEGDAAFHDEPHRF